MEAAQIAALDALLISIRAIADQIAKVVDGPSHEVRDLAKAANLLAIAHSILNPMHN